MAPVSPEQFEAYWLDEESLTDPVIYIEVPVSALKGAGERELTAFIRLKKYEFGRQLQDILTKWIRENVTSITLPEPPVRN